LVELAYSLKAQCVPHLPFELKTCEMYRISGEKVIELFYQEPRFGFSGLKTSERLEAAGIKLCAA